MVGKTRSYHAPARSAAARETRRRILLAAHDLFVRRGFSATVPQIAEAAGVSRATVELAFATKAALLDAVVDVALAGDDEPVPVLERPWVHDLAMQPTVPFLDGVGAGFAAGAARVSPLLRALDEGASAGDARLAALRARLTRQRSVMAGWVVDRLTERDALASDLTFDAAVDEVLVLIDPLLQGRLLVERGWPVERLAVWTARSMRRLVTDLATT